MPKHPDDPRLEKDTPGRKHARNQAMAVAWSLGWPIAAGILLGSWLDGYFGTSPLLILVLSLGALAGAVRQLIAIGTGSGNE